MPEQPRIVAVGSYMHAFVLRADRFPDAGETVFGSDSEIGPGGKGSNQAIGAARLGALVTLLGSVGGDAFGEYARALWRDEGLHIDLVIRDPERATGMAFIMVDATGQNRIIVVPGANDALRVEGPECESAIASAHLVMAQFESPVEAVVGALTLARRHGVRTVLNPAPARVVGDDLLALADVITPNESETEALTGVQVATAGPLAAARALRKRGPRAVILTLGAAGAYILDDDGGRHVPGMRVRALDTTGAGDAFTAALAVALARARTLDDAVAEATRAGAYCVTRRGVVPGLGTVEQLASLREAPLS